MSQREQATPSVTRSASITLPATAKHPHQERALLSSYPRELVTMLICGGITLLSSYHLSPPTSKPPATSTAPKQLSHGLQQWAQRPTHCASTTEPTMQHRVRVVGSAHNHLITKPVLSL